MAKQLQFDSAGLIPAIIQDMYTKKVLMLGYMNEEAMQRTIETKRVHFYSRSRKRLWCKGETSGNYQYLKGIFYDCDADALLVLVKQEGVSCHTGNYSCFFEHLVEVDKVNNSCDIIDEVYKVIRQRKLTPKPNSYTCTILNEGLKKIHQKIKEETEELLCEQQPQRIIEELVDVWYHTLLLLAYYDIDIVEVYDEFRRRRRA